MHETPDHLCGKAQIGGEIIEATFVDVDNVSVQQLPRTLVIPLQPLKLDSSPL